MELILMVFLKKKFSFGENGPFSPENGTLS